MKKEDLLDLAREPETLTVTRAANVLGINRMTLTNAIKAGQLSRTQIGKRKYLLRDELLKFLGR